MRGFKVERAVIATILAIHVGLLAWGAARNSFAWTETGLLPSGLWNWRYENLDVFRVNPPLLRMIAALPVLAMEPRIPNMYVSPDPRERAEWELGKRMVADHGERSFWMLTVARWACIPFSVLGAWICFSWAKELSGTRAGLYSLGLWCFSPDVLAHGQMITGDLAATSVGALTFFAYRQWLRTPGWLLAIHLGFAWGFSLAMKSSWLLIFALIPLIWLTTLAWRTRNQCARKWWVELLMLTFSLFLSVLIINLTYGFDGSFKRLGEYRFASMALGNVGAEPQDSDWSGNRFQGTALGRVPVPLPEDFVQGIDLQKWDLERKRWSYLCGEWRERGWWYYYLYAFAIKVPLGFSLSLLAALIAIIFGRIPRLTWLDSVVLLVPVLAVLGMASSQTGLNKHFRYVLPIFPFLIIVTSRLLADWASHRAWRFIVGLGLVWTITSSLWIYPHSLSYFNESIGGPTNGHHHLTSSNIDWGQDLLFLKRWHDTHHEARPLRVAYYLHLVSPISAGIPQSTKPPYFSPHFSQTQNKRFAPQPGWFAIDVGHLTRRDGAYQFYERFEPKAWAGYSFRIYEVTLADANRVRAELGLLPLKEGEATE